MPLRRVDPTTYRVQPWASGGGTTTELAAGPDPDRWRWRISQAQVDAAGRFSTLPGVRRQIAPLDGALHLHFADGRDLRLERLQVLAFDGDPAPDCELPDGPGRDFNLMLRDNVEGTLIARPLVGHMILPVTAAQRWFAYLLAGRATLSDDDDSIELEPGQAAWVEAPTAGRTVLDGAGEIALVRLNLD